MIVEDSEGWLWLFETENWQGAFGIKNLAFLNIHTLEVQSVKERFGTLPFLVSDIFSAIATEKGEIWLGLRNGNLIKCSKSESFKIHRPSIPRNNLKLYQQTNDGALLSALFSKKQEEA